MSSNDHQCIENPAKIEDIEILLVNQNFVVVNKRWDVLINSNDQADEVTVETQLRHLYPHLVDPKLGHSFRLSIEYQPN